jgi:gluconokinase
MPNVPGLRSPYAKVGRLVYFGRMLDKARLHAAGKLPADYAANLGDTGTPTFFDARCCRFLRVPYADFRAQALAVADDASILAWCHERGGPRTDEECNVWNRFMMKLGWRDERSEMLQSRIREYGFANRGLAIETIFDLFDYDEGRDPVATRAWQG